MMTRSIIVLVGVTFVSAVVVGYGTARYVVSERLEDATNLVKLDIATQQTTIAALSEVMTRGGVDEVTESVINDCAAVERDRFDALLGRLGENLSAGELSELSRLFDRCASYYARQKAVMAARFEREVEVYILYIQRLVSLVPRADLTLYAAPTWQKLAQFEREQSSLFARLVDLQGQIITVLMSGKSVGDPAITDLLSAVRETQEMQAYNVLQMSELRSQLPSAL